MQDKSLAIYLPDLSGGGIERMFLRLAPHFVAAGWKVTFLLAQLRGELSTEVPAECEVVALNSTGQLQGTKYLASFLRRRRPAVLVANTEHTILSAVLATLFAGGNTKLVSVYHTGFSQQVSSRSIKYRVLGPPTRMLLPRSSRIVCVSKGVANDLSEAVGVERSSIEVIYNGCVSADGSAEQSRSEDTLRKEHLIVGVGRLVPQKDFATLIRSFALLPQDPATRLVILGEGPERTALQNLIKEMNLSGRVSLPGFVPNPAFYLKRASVFVLSSEYEGFGNVIVEALSLGTQVVSTDCPFGPTEILDGGKYGRLVPIGDYRNMAQAVAEALAHPIPRSDLIARGSMFSVEGCAKRYLAVFEGAMTE